jgi:hypothetical protein
LPYFPHFVIIFIIFGHFRCHCLRSACSVRYVRNGLVSWYWGRRGWRIVLSLSSSPWICHIHRGLSILWSLKTNIVEFVMSSSGFGVSICLSKCWW